MKSNSNPNEVINGLMAGNPQMKGVMDLVNQHNGDARSAFYELAKEKGVNPDEIINALK